MAKVAAFLSGNDNTSISKPQFCMISKTFLIFAENYTDTYCCKTMAQTKNVLGLKELDVLNHIKGCH